MDQQLLVFVNVVEKKSFSRAAKDLYMTQPAVTQYIQSLERTVGAKLLERSNKSVRLTQAGEIVYDHAKEIIGQYDQMQRFVEDLLKTATGPLPIGATGQRNTHHASVFHRNEEEPVSDESDRSIP